MAASPNPPPAGAAATAPETIVTAPAQGFLIAGRVVTPLTPRSPTAGAA